MRTWLIDTGPLVAYLDRDDPEHEPVATCLAQFSGQLCTTSAVLVEAMHFVAADRDGPGLLVDLVEASGLLIHESTQASQLRQAARLMKKYADTPMDFADATLVLLASN
ncbi:MAG: PIN domain-containing protein [Acidobacteria bacterium]|nr:PIN domain-containing protein [Acidobacteriota bacterium]